MKTTTLFQLGGLATLLAAILYATSSLIYFVSGQPAGPTALGLWLNFFGDTLLLLGLGALFARQAQRGGVPALAGYVLMVLGTVFYIGNYAVALGIAAGAFTDAQIAQVPAYTRALAIMPWIWDAGLILFGISIYRAQVLPKYAGLLLVLIPFVQELGGVVGLFNPIFAILSAGTWAWLGLALLREKPAVSREAVVVVG
jgi:hypothetical protein